MEYKRIDNARAFLNQYIGYYENKLTTVKVSGRKKNEVEVHSFSTIQNNYYIHLMN